LYIGGVQVARGYLNRPELTAEKFIPDPFSALSEARLYRTGDLARYLPGGEIEYLGRTDHQVKIRGFRIELGEIETVLEEHVSVGQAVVMAREDVPGNKRLVAYMIGAAGQTPSASVLRDHLKERLPEYMVPSAFVPLEKFPLSSNGKVDRKALPVPEYARPELEDAYVAPRTPTEQALAEIWTAVLGVERIGVTDNFFALGGNSLLAVRLFVRVRKWAGIDLPLATLFKSPTIGGLAELLSSSSHKTTGSGEAKSFDVSSLVQQSRCLVPIRPEGKRPPVFLIHAIGGNMLYYFSMLDHLGHDQPVYGLQARGVDGMLPPHTSITAMASHYINEIRSVQPSGPYFMGGASFGGTVAFEIARQLMHQGEDVAFLALLDSIGPGPRGYRHWRDALRWRLSPTKEVDDQTQQITLLLYLLKRTTRFLANRISILKCALCSLSSHQIPLELREVYLTRCHDKAIKSYVPHQYLGPITLFRGPSGNEWPHSDPELGWKNIAKGVFKIIPIPAGHHEFVESVELGNKFAEELKSAQEHSL
jgi:thioesterase domain-containing protein/acyl carrier protein